MLSAISRRSSPSTLASLSRTSRSRPICSSLRFLTRRFGSTFAIVRTRRAVWGPTPKMYVSAISTRFSRECQRRQFEPSTLLSLPLVVFRRHADDPHLAAALDDLALRTYFLDRRSNFHFSLCLSHDSSAARIER